MQQDSRDSDSKRAARGGRGNQSVWVVSIITSLVASIIFAIFLEPVTELFSRVVLSGAGRMFQSQIDRMFASAVVNSNAGAIHDIQIILYATILGAIAFFLGRVHSGWIQHKGSGKSFASVEEQQRYANSMWRQLFFMVLGTLVFVWLVIMISFTSSMIAGAASSAFERRLLILTPVLDEAERGALLGAWGMVETEAGFRDVMKQTDGLAAKYMVRLPPLRV